MDGVANTDQGANAPLGLLSAKSGGAGPCRHTGAAPMSDVPPTWPRVAQAQRVSAVLSTSPSSGIRMGAGGPGGEAGVISR